MLDKFPVKLANNRTNIIFFVNRTRDMVSFELGKEIEKDVLSTRHERGTKKKF